MRRVVLDCDNCGAEGKGETVGPFDLGSGPQSAELCIECQDALHVTRLIALAREYGVELDEPVKMTGKPAGKRPVRKPGAIICPVCEQEGSSRGGMIGHMGTQHNMSMPEASRALSFPGPGETCPSCGYYGPKQGMTLHRKTHGSVILHGHKHAPGREPVPA